MYVESYYVITQPVLPSPHEAAFFPRLGLGFVFDVDPRRQGIGFKIPVRRSVDVTGFSVGQLPNSPTEETLPFIPPTQTLRAWY